MQFLTSLFGGSENTLVTAALALALVASALGAVPVAVTVNVAGAEPNAVWPAGCTVMDGALPPENGWLAPGAKAGACPRCGAAMVEVPELVARLVSRTIQSGGRARTYILRLPGNYSSSRSYRLVVGLHWLNGSANDVVGNGFYGLQQRAKALILKLKGATTGKLLIVYLFIRQIAAGNPLGAAKTILTAKLVLTTSSYGVGWVPRDWFIYALASSWSGDTVTWNIANGFQHYVYSQTQHAPPVYPGQVYELDQTATVRNWVGGAFVNQGWQLGLTNWLMPYVTSSSIDPASAAPASANSACHASARRCSTRRPSTRRSWRRSSRRVGACPHEDHRHRLPPACRGRRRAAACVDALIEQSQCQLWIVCFYCMIDRFLRPAA